jgi:hypothetical protein
MKIELTKFEQEQMKKFEQNQYLRNMGRDYVSQAIRDIYKFLINKDVCLCEIANTMMGDEYYNLVLSKQWYHLLLLICKSFGDEYYERVLNGYGFAYMDECQDIFNVIEYHHKIWECIDEQMEIVPY